MSKVIVAIGRTLGLLLISFVIVGLLYQASGFPLADVFTGAIQGAVTAPGALTSTIRWTIPLLLVGLGVLIAFRAGFFNVGAQGQYYAGSIAALAITLSLKDGPAFVVLPLAVVGAVAAGALWALVPGMLRVRSGTDEVITSLMMNFIGILLLQYVTGGPLKDPSGSGQVTASRTINSAFRLTDTSGVSPALVLITAAVCLLVWLYVNRSTVGLQATLAGRNPMMARWQGINVGRLGLLGFALGGGLAGLAGSLELLGPSGRLVGGFYPGLGFTAILVPLMANLNVLGSIAAALFFGGLSSAILYIPIVTALPHSAFDLLNGVVAMLITVRLVSMPRLRSLVPKSSLGRGGTATRNADEGGH